MNISVLGIDIAKLTFELYGVDSQGRKVISKRLSRHKLLAYIALLPPCLIGMEACGGAHYWARQFQKQGHQVKLMNPQFVKPYVKSNKNDVNDGVPRRPPFLWVKVPPWQLPVWLGSEECTLRSNSQR